MKLAFLTATFPSLTETFVFREWDCLRRDQELDIQVFSIRKPQGFSVIELPEGKNMDVQYLRPNHVWRVVFTWFWFPLCHPVRAGRVAKMLLKELRFHPWRRENFLPIPILINQALTGTYLGMYLKRHGFEAIHGHFNAAAGISMFASLASDIPFSYTVYANGDLFMAPLEFFEEKLQHCKIVITDTEYNRRMINLLTEFRYEEKIKVIYTGLDLKNFNNFKAKKSFGTPLRLLSVGSMSGFKGYPTVLAALSMLKKHGLGFEYRIVGGGNTDLVEKLIDRYGLQDSVTLLGAKSFNRVRDEFEWCDVFVMASEIHSGGRRDGFPTVIAEAMLMQRLLIATYISDIPNNVLDRETGLLVAEKSPDQLAEAMEYVIHNQDKCREIVANAHRMAVEKYDARVNYKRLAELLKSEVMG